MFFKVDNVKENEGFDVYLNSNMIMQVFSPDERVTWYARLQNEEEYEIPLEMAEKITGKKLVEEESEE